MLTRKKQWFISSSSKELFKLFLIIDKNSPRKNKLSRAVLNIPFLGFFLAKLISSGNITFLREIDDSFYVGGLTISSLKNYIVDKKDKIFNSSSPKVPFKLSFLLFVGTRNYIFYVSSEKKISLFIKTTLDKKLEYMLEEEFKNIKYLHTKLNTPLKNTIPSLCLLEEIKGCKVLILNYMVGVCMSEEISTSQVKKIHHNVMLALRWLVEFQRETKTSKCKVISLEEEVKSLLSKYTSLDPIADEVRTFFKTHVIGKIREFRNIEIPLVISHGDFFPNNILIEGEKIKIVDWADMEMDRLPTDDLFMFFHSFSLLNRYKKKDEEILNGFRFTFLEKNWFSTLTKICFDWYCEETRITRELLNQLFHINLLRKSVLEADGVDRIKMTSHQEWKKRLELYVKSEKNFVLG